MKIQKLGIETPVKALVVTRNGKTIKCYEKCSFQYAIQNDCGIETDGFIVNENEAETFYARPNHYEALA